MWRVSLNHLRRWAREEEAQLLCSLPYTLSAELSCALSLYFLLQRGKQEEHSEEEKRKQSTFPSPAAPLQRRKLARSLAAELKKVLVCFL